jgi:hypothetical protein
MTTPGLLSWAAQRLDAATKALNTITVDIKRFKLISIIKSPDLYHLKQTHNKYRCGSDRIIGSKRLFEELAIALERSFMAIKVAFAVSLICCSTIVSAKDESNHSEDDPVPVEIKLTPSYYQDSDGNNASDMNIRGSRGPQAGWIGFYRDHNGFQQTRTGYELTRDFELAYIVSSVQAASGGFLGGSINVQLGNPVYAIVGFGRTNLRTYYNLNFDPNDAITIGVGTKAIPDTEISLFHIWDDRLDTRQRVTHLYLHRTVSKKERFSIDGSYKSGLTSDNNFVAGYALTVTYTYRHYFVRIAHDQYVNFSNTTQNRLSLGMTF